MSENVLDFCCAVFRSLQITCDEILLHACSFPLLSIICVLKSLMISMFVFPFIDGTLLAVGNGMEFWVLPCLDWLLIQKIKDLVEEENFFHPCLNWILRFLCLLYYFFHPIFLLYLDHNKVSFSIYLISKTMDFFPKFYRQFNPIIQTKHNNGNNLSIQFNSNMLLLSLH